MRMRAQLFECAPAFGKSIVFHECGAEIVWRCLNAGIYEPPTRDHPHESGWALCVIACHHPFSRDFAEKGTRTVFDNFAILARARPRIGDAEFVARTRYGDMRQAIFLF